MEIVMRIDKVGGMFCFKCVIIDGTFAWFGSANLTGAGKGTTPKNST